MRLLTGFPKGVHTLSVTQLKLWKSCPRAWGFRYIAGIKTPQTDGQRLGSRVHAILEGWLRDGTIPDEAETMATDKGLKYPGRIAAAGLSLLPPPPQMYVEEKFWLELEPGVVIYGLIDLRPEQLVGVHDVPVEVIDHKTSTNFKWAMGKTQLFSDEQAVVYGLVGCLKTHRGSARSKWVYYRTTGRPTAMPVSTTQYREELERKVLDLLPLARTILAAKDIIKDVNELDFNPAHCGAYGGCPHKERCNVSPRESFVAAMNVNDFVNTQLAKQGQAPTTTETAPPPPPPKSAEPPPPPPAQTEAPPPPPTTTTAPAPAKAKPAKGDPPVEAYDPSDRKTWTRAQLKAKAVELAILEDSSKHGRAKILDLLDEYELAMDEEPPPAEEQPSPEEVLERYDDPRAKQHMSPWPDGETPIGRLYVDCIPYQDSTVVPLSKLVAQALEGFGFDDDYRIEPENGYGKAAGVLSSAVERIVREYAPCDIFASTRYAEHRDCLAMLEGLALRIIKGV